MNVASPSRCPRCGSPDSAHALAAGLCPSCLIAAALSEDDGPCPYRVLAPMDEDAAGVTYLAQSLSGLRGYVALKVHDRHRDIDAVLARYEQWKPALAAVRHPSLSRFVDAGVTAEGLLYIATEYVAGSPLTTLESPLSDVEARSTLTSQLTGAIAAAHAEGLAHMSLEPSKVKISTADGPHATILGLGTRLVVDGVEPRQTADLEALARLIRRL
jgi:serine/threonine protein kinase